MLMAVALCCGGVVRAEDTAALVELGKIRDTLRARREQRLQADPEGREYVLQLAPGFGRQPLKLTLLRVRASPAPRVTSSPFWSRLGARR
jgi:hypothetical protein